MIHARHQTHQRPGGDDTRETGDVRAGVGIVIVNTMALATFGFDMRANPAGLPCGSFGFLLHNACYPNITVMDWICRRQIQSITAGSGRAGSSSEKPATSTGQASGILLKSTRVRVNSGVKTDRRQG